MATSHPTSPRHPDDTVVYLDDLRGRHPTTSPPPRLRLLDFVLAGLFGAYVVLAVALVLFLFLVD